MLENEHTETLPEVRETTEITPHHENILKLQEQTFKVVADSLTVLHKAIIGAYYNGKKVTRNQVLAAGPIVAKFLPKLESVGSGGVHLHLNIPRHQEPKVIQAKPSQSVPDQSSE